MTALVGGGVARALMPMANFNRLHLVPPLTTTVEQVREAVVFLDEAPTAARKAQ